MFRQADLIDISKATNIAGTSFDSSATPVAPKGKLASGVTAATYVPFVNFINSTQLARFALHNGMTFADLRCRRAMNSDCPGAGSPANQQLIDAKWESLALAPCDDAAFPNDYFLFTAVRCVSRLQDQILTFFLRRQADNDFISTHGVFNGQSFNAGLDNDNQFMVFRVTLPTAAAGSVAQSIGL